METSIAYAKLIKMQTEGLGKQNQCNDATMKNIYGPEGAATTSIAALETVKAHLACESINPLIVRVTHNAICDSTVSGMLALFNTQVCAGVLIVVTLHYASFVRPYMNPKPKDLEGTAKVEP